MKKKAIVISGGGSLGAFAGGIAEALVTEKHKKYDLVVGTSTGSLMSPLIALKDFKTLKNAYTSVTQKDILSFNPFNKKGKINIFKVIFRLLKGLITHKVFSLGESKTLRKQISRFFNKEQYTQLINSGIDVKVCVVNATSKTKEYKSIKDCLYEDFCDWMWISANAPIYMSLVEKNGFYYMDGGIKEHIPAQVAIDDNCDEIDIIVLRTKNFNDDKVWVPKDILNVLERVIQILFEEGSSNDIDLTKLEASEKNIKLNIYYLPKKLTDNSLMFDKQQMLKWWDEGFEYAKNDLNAESYILDTSKCITKIS